MDASEKDIIKKKGFCKYLRNIAMVLVNNKPRYVSRKGDMQRETGF